MYWRCMSCAHLQGVGRQALEQQRVVAARAAGRSSGGTSFARFGRQLRAARQCLVDSHVGTPWTRPFCNRVSGRKW